MFKKQRIAGLTALFLISSFLHAQSIDFSTMLGFNGLYEENAWTPLLVRLSNKGPAVTGVLKVITDNSGTASEQIREYNKPVDLPAGSDKVLSFVIPIGHHNRDLTLILTSDGEELINDRISLKQKGVRGKFIIVVSPYPDLSLPPEHPVFDRRNVVFPHPDTLPDSPLAYNGTSIISMHREYYDRLTNNQFDAISGWVSSGGVLAVWGGKSPSPSKRNYLPSQITGLRRISGSYLLVNITETPEENKILLESGFEAGSLRRSGEGSIFFFPYDYSVNALQNWDGIGEIWNRINSSVPQEDTFRSSMDEPFLLEDYIRLFDNSGFTYLDRINVALVLFLSVSVSFSMLILVRLRKESQNIYRYIAFLMLLLVLLSSSLFIILFNSTYRKESFALDINLVYQKGISEKAIYYKDLLIGSSGRTRSDITLPYSTSAIVKRDTNENIRLNYKPELSFENIDMEQWSSRIFRFEQRTESLCDFFRSDALRPEALTVSNKSDSAIRNGFLLKGDKIYKVETILPGEEKTFLLNDLMAESHSDTSDDLRLTTAYMYLNHLMENSDIIFCGFLNESFFPAEFSNKTWKSKSVSIVINRLNTGEGSYD